MEEVLRLIDRVAPTDSSVLVLGESGTGKELVARAIHDRSPRAPQAFVPIHCGALAREVLESELFGHEKGAFTGAIATKPGLIELADGGTLFLDEIGEMEPESQVKLLRVLESHAFFRVGGTRRRTRGHAAGRRDQPRSRRGDQDRRVPPGPLLPHQHDHDHAAAPARAARGRAPPRRALPRAERDLRPQAAVRRGHGRAGALRLARQRPRAAARGAARGDPVAGRRRSSPPTCPTRFAAAGPRARRRAEASRTWSASTSSRRCASVGGHRAKAATVLGIDPKTLYRKIQAYGIVPDLYQ